MAVCRAGAVANEMTHYSRLQTCRKSHRHVRDTRASFNVINGGSHAGNHSALEEFTMWPSGAAIIGTEVYHTLKCPSCTRVCAKPKEYTHVCSRGTLRPVPGLCLLSLPIQWSFRECFVEAVLRTEIGIVQTLCIRQFLRRVLMPMRRATCKLMVSLDGSLWCVGNPHWSVV